MNTCIKTVKQAERFCPSGGGTYTVTVKDCKVYAKATSSELSRMVADEVREQAINLGIKVPY